MKEFSFRRNAFTRPGVGTLEVADHVVWLSDLLFVFQQKQREGKSSAADTVIGKMPRYEDMALSGISGFSKAAFEKLTEVDGVLWKAEVKDHERMFGELASRMPAEMMERRRQLEQAL